MKCAICLYGQPRFFKKSFSFLKQNVIDPNNILDIFFHAWYDKDKVGHVYDNVPPWLSNGKSGNIEENTDVDLIKLYNPKKYIIEKQKQFNIIKDYSSNGTMSPPFVLFSCFYSVLKSVELCRSYEVENNFKYDWIFIIRYDMIIKNKIDLTLLSNDNFYFCDDIKENAENKKQINNNFIFSSSDNMNMYSKLFDHMDNYWTNDGVRMGGECMAGWHMDKCGKKVPLPVDYAFIRKFGSGTHEIDENNL